MRRSASAPKPGRPHRDGTGGGDEGVVRGPGEAGAPDAGGEFQDVRVAGRKWPICWALLQKPALTGAVGAHSCVRLEPGDRVMGSRKYP